MAMVLNYDMWIFLLYACGKLGKESRSSDTCHILKTDLVAAIFYYLIDYAHVVIHGMDRRIGYRKSNLRNHSRLLGILHTETEVTMVIKSTERTGDICTLSLLDLVHKFAHVSWHWVHTKCIQTSLKHMSLDSGLSERRSPFAYSPVRILSKEEINLLESTSICLHTVKATHIDDCRSNLFQLTDCRNILS